MCGIIGYIGDKPALPFLINGLAQMEYRGYDSSGVALGASTLHVHRASGELAHLKNTLPDSHEGQRGIAHTRWATHGEPTKENAHPHRDCSHSIALVHNGIIENFAEIKSRLSSAHTFTSQTDTEVLAHLIEELSQETASIEEAFRRTLQQVRGTYGIAMMSTQDPDHLYVARLGSPIVVGTSTSENFVASDPSAFMMHTRKHIVLDDGEFARISKQEVEVRQLDRTSVSKSVELIEWNLQEAKKDGHDHFMHKEIHEQPKTIQDSLRGRLDASTGHIQLGGLRDVAERLRELDRLIIVGCGSAYYAGLTGEYLLETIAGIPVEVELASEFRYREPVITRHTAVLAISQSGETADTLAAIREAKKHGALTLGIVNAPGSTIARETDAGVYNHAGPEIGVASTKAFVSQLTVLALVSLFLGRQRGLPEEEARSIAASLASLPKQVERILENEEQISKIARTYQNMQGCFFLGRKFQLPVAYEGALKLKEVSYIHAEGYGAGEMKHGPLALVDPQFPSIVLAPSDPVADKTLSNVEEIKARKGPVIAVVDDTRSPVAAKADHTIIVPKTHEALSPILTTIPLQLLAYHAAIQKNLNPDRPRNLAKSVTVE